MIYASTKSTLRSSLQGIGAEILGTDLSEVASDAGALLFLYSALSSSIDFGSQCLRKSSTSKVHDGSPGLQVATRSIFRLFGFGYPLSPDLFLYCLSNLSE